MEWLIGSMNFWISSRAFTVMTSTWHKQLYLAAASSLQKASKYEDASHGAVHWLLILVTILETTSLCTFEICVKWIVIVLMRVWSI